MIYPPTTPDRVRFALDRRRAKNVLDARDAYGAFVEEEPDGLGSTVRISTILLTNRECPWKCVFCDLWTNTLDETVPLGAIPEQIRASLAGLSPARWIKLYNAGSFFDPRAIPPGDIPVIADLLAPFERVIVESHPALIGEGVASPVLHLRDCLRSHSIDPSRPTQLSRSIALTPSTESHGPVDAPARPFSSAAFGSFPSLDPYRDPPADSLGHSSSRLEVAMGLETVHPVALERLNKGMTLDDFARAADVLNRSDIDLRAFVLVQPPFAPPEEAVLWALRSLDFAREHGARFVSLIPTRGGNGAMEALRDSGDFVPPRLATLEEALDRALERASSHGSPIVAADLWDLERFSDCPQCFASRAERLRRMNLSQKIEPRVSCVCSPPDLRVVDAPAG